MKKHTIGGKVQLSGINVYNGDTTHTVIMPSNSGRIEFKVGDEIIPASLGNAQVRGCVIYLKGETEQVALAEHVLSALYRTGIHSARILLQPQKCRDQGLKSFEAGVPPTFKDVTKSYIAALKSVGAEELSEDVTYWQANEKRTIQSPGKPDSLRVEPHDKLTIAYTIGYEEKGIAEQNLVWDYDPEAFDKDIADARSPTLWLPSSLHLPFLRIFSAFHGVDEQNYLITTGNKNKPYRNNPRYDDEIARHKVVDLLGIMALAGKPFRNTKFTLHKTGMTFEIESLESLIREGVFTPESVVVTNS